MTLVDKEARNRPKDETIPPVMIVKRVPSWFNTKLATGPAPNKRPVFNEPIHHTVERYWENGLNCRRYIPEEKLWPTVVACKMNEMIVIYAQSPILVALIFA